MKRSRPQRIAAQKATNAMSEIRKRAFSGSSASSSGTSDLQDLHQFDLPPSASDMASPNQLLDESGLPYKLWQHQQGGEQSRPTSFWPEHPHGATQHFEPPIDYGYKSTPPFVLHSYSTRDSIDPLTIGPSGSVDLNSGGGQHHQHDGGNDYMNSVGGESSPFIGTAMLTRQASSTPSATASDVKEEDRDEEEESESDSDDNRKKGSPAFRPRGRKKRNKCSPEQLQSLEAFFAKNRNPTGRIREELSKKLKMPERSVQVWFQNRRAKVKVLERRGLEPDGDGSGRKGAPGSGSPNGQKRSSSTKALKKEDSSDQAPSVTALPTTALCVGSWRRVSPLVCFFSRRLQTLTWYLSSDSIGFKLEMPWTSIKSAHFDGPTQPSVAERYEGVRHPLGHFTIELERPPTFFMEVFRSTATEESGETKKACWRQCSDFTEGHQATLVRCHVLSGPYEELRQAIQAFSQTNDVLERLVQFKDTERRKAGNFTPLPELGLDLNESPMQYQPAQLQGSPWHDYRSPNWDLNSPASVISSLSHGSMEGYPMSASSSHSSFHEPRDPSPRNPFNALDLTGLRIETTGISSFNSLMDTRQLHGGGGWEVPPDSAPASYQWDQPPLRKLEEDAYATATPTVRNPFGGIHPALEDRQEH